MESLDFLLSHTDRDNVSSSHCRSCSLMWRKSPRTALLAAKEPLFAKQFVGTFMGAVALVGVADKAMSSHNISTFHH